MSKKYYIDAISDETLVKMIDKTLNFEKNNTDIKKRRNLLKIIPAVACILFVIATVNIFSYIANIDFDGGANDGITDDNVVYTNTTNETTDVESDLFLPEIVEKNFFERKVLAKITDKRALDKLEIYYTLNDDAF